VSEPDQFSAGCSSIRNYLPLAGKRVVDVTCDDDYEPFLLRDKDDVVEVRVKRVYLHFEDGHTLTFHSIEDQLGFGWDGDT
jgi:hypothetical protein